jgi:hypothetical protein
VLPVPAIGDYASDAADGRARATAAGAPPAACALSEWAPPTGAAGEAALRVTVEGCAATGVPGCARVFAELTAASESAGAAAAAGGPAATVAFSQAPGEAALRAALAGYSSEQLAQFACALRGQSAVVLTGASVHPALATLAVALEVPLFAPSPALLAAWQANASTAVSAELAAASLPALPADLAMLLPPDGVPRAVTAGTCSHHPANAAWSAAWLGYADGAYVKGAVVYSSLRDLAARLRAVDLAGAHRKLQRHRRANRRLTHRSWEAVFRALLSRRAPGVPPPIPASPAAAFAAFQAAGAKPVFAAVPGAVPDDGARRGDKWIVITTINEPTAQVKTLASTAGGWRVAVVGDLATPPDWMWDNCEYLGPDAQRSRLGFGVVPLLPWNAYTRKNIGYLYAIAHGARTVYDTDDDNVILGDDPFTLPECVAPAAGVGVTAPGSHRVINPHVYWADEHLHPRGFPLEDVKHPGARHYAVARAAVPVRVGVLQGLVNGDPDVDAVQRLTKRVKGTQFSAAGGHDALVVGAGTLVPFNSQNTVFHYSAFWALMLPSTTTFRVCDIWRGYWTARLLWDVGARLGFLRATAVQDRNAHSLLKDFVDEVDLYVNAGSLVDFLLAWRGAEGDTLPQRCVLRARRAAAAWVRAPHVLVNAPRPPPLPPPAPRVISATTRSCGSWWPRGSSSGPTQSRRGRGCRISPTWGTSSRTLCRHSPWTARRRPAAAGARPPATSRGEDIVRARDVARQSPLAQWHGVLTQAGMHAGWCRRRVDRRLTGILRLVSTVDPSGSSRHRVSALAMHGHGAIMSHDS